MGDSDIFQPQIRKNSTFQFTDNVAWVSGRHTWKFGERMCGATASSIWWRILGRASSLSAMGPVRFPARTACQRRRTSPAVKLLVSQIFFSADLSFLMPRRGNSIRRELGELERDESRQQSAARQAAAVASLEKLRPGDIIDVPGEDGTKASPSCCSRAGPVTGGRCR